MSCGNRDEGNRPVSEREIFLNVGGTGLVCNFAWFLSLFLGFGYEISLYSFDVPSLAKLARSYFYSFAWTEF